MIFYDAVGYLVEALLTAAYIGLVLIGIGYLSLPILYFLQRIKARGAKERSNETDMTVLAEDAVPAVLIQLPIFNEGAMVQGLLRAVTALDWPKERLQIQLLDDSNDGTSEKLGELIAELRKNGSKINHLRRSDRHGFKAGALAHGLARSDAPFVAIFDADFRPPRNWLRSVIPCFAADPRIGFVQSRCEFVNSDTNWLTRAQGLLLDAHFVMEQAVRARAGLLFQFNGTGGIWRRAAIDEVGGWCVDTIGEDFDLTVRAALAGWRGKFLMQPVVPGLVPDRIRHWRVQQRRWVTGFAQVARKVIGPIWRSNWSLLDKLAVSFLIFYQAFLPLFVIAVALYAADLALRNNFMSLLTPIIAGILLLASVTVTMTLPPYLALRRGGLFRYLRTVITLPPLIFYLSFANARAAVGAFLGRREAFKRTPKFETEASLYAIGTPAPKEAKWAITPVKQGGAANPHMVE